MINKKRMLMGAGLLLAFAFIVTLFPKQNVNAQADSPFVGIKWMESQMDGSLQPFGAFIPDPADKDSPRPIVFVGHGAGGRVSAPGAGTQPNKWIMDNGKNWIAVRLDYRGPQANNQGQFDPFDVIRHLEEVDGYTLDHNRFYITGGSLGGSDAYRLALRYPDMWAGVAPQTGWTDYREFWPHWYEHSDKASVLRRSMFEGFQTTNLNIRNNVHNMTYYVDPSLVPMLETESPLWQAKNGLNMPLFIMSCYDDATNLRMNQEQIRDVYEENDYDHVFKQVMTGGHGCKVLDWDELMPWFESKVRDEYPLEAIYTTNTLQYNSAHWLQLDKFVTENVWAELKGSIDEDTQQAIDLQTKNLAKFTLKLNDQLIADMDEAIDVTIDGEFNFTLMPAEALTFEAEFDENNVFAGWNVSDAQRNAGIAFEAPEDAKLLSLNLPLDRSGEALEKAHGVSGPFSDAMFNPFVVVYGTQGTEAENADSLRAAQEFAMEWNNWLILHIGNYSGYATATPSANVWEGIPDFPYYSTNSNAWAPGGASTPQANTWIVRPVADVDLTYGDATSRNVILFGEPSTNAIIKYLEDELPFEFAPGSITVDDRIYADGAGNNPKDEERIDYSFVYPNPLNKDKYIAVSRYGLWMDWKDPQTAWLKFTSTGIEFQSFAFQFPDYFIGWRLDGKLMDGVHGMYFQDTWFESGYFDGDWKLNDVAPISTAEVVGDLASGLFVGEVQIALSANDRPGGFGVERIEYSLDGGNTWEVYDGTPLSLTAIGDYNFQYRSVGKSGKFEYGMIDPWAQFGKTFQDGEQWLSFPSWENVEVANEINFTIAGNTYFPIILH